jgi:hypothetical protein
VRIRGARRLSEDSFIERAALVDPATISGLDFIAVPGTSVGLKHEGFIGLEEAPLGMVDGLVEPSTRDVGILVLHEGRGAVASLPAYIHRANEVLHLKPLK